MIRHHPCTVREITEAQVANALLQFHRNLAMAETLAHLAYLRWQGLIERRTRKDGIYEWYSTDESPKRCQRQVPAVDRNPVTEEQRG
jgi:hypothetical protein